jgi:uncharacterized protein YjbI with pentapeptide repeats
MMRKQMKSHPRITIFILFLVALALTILIGGYRYHWAWTGFIGDKGSYKTLYDWLQLLFVPAALIGFGFWLNSRESNAAKKRVEKERKEEDIRTYHEQKVAERRAEEESRIEQQRAESERNIAQDNQRESALHRYIDNMSELLLTYKLRDSKPDDEVRRIARVRTLTVLPRLDGERKGSLLQFLNESGLINTDSCIIDLRRADLSEAELFGANLYKTNLSAVNLNKAILIQATLGRAILYGASLEKAYLSEASLNGADLSEFSLDEADLGNASLNGAKLNEANLHKACLNKACLGGADLTGAFLDDADISEADLSEANLLRAIVTSEQLAKAKSLKGATMPDGSLHP